jgi:hypothetical protein
MSAAGVSMSVEQQEVIAIGRAMRAEGDGLKLRADLMLSLRAAVQPGVDKVQGKLRAMPSTGVGPKPAVGSYLASRVKAQVRLSGPAAGVAVRIAKTPKLRSWTNAARVLNRGRWRHPVFGHDVWVDQSSPIPGFFDDTLAEDKDEYRAAVMKALARMRMRLEIRASTKL